MEPIRICKKCGKALPETKEFFYTQFNKKVQKEYFKGSCKECCKKQSAEWHHTHPEKLKIIERNRYMRYKNDEEYKEKRRECQRRYYHSEIGQAAKRKYREEHSEELKAKALERYYADKDRAREQKKRWMKENPEKVLEARRRYREKHKDEINARRRASATYEKAKERAREYRRKHPDADRNHCHVRRARMRGLEATFTVEQWELVQIEFGKRCAYCGRAMKLSQDHVIPLNSGGTYTKDNIVPACKRCNSSKAARPFSEWYRAQPFYNEEREKHVLEYIGKEIAV